MMSPAASDIDLAAITAPRFQRLSLFSETFFGIDTAARLPADLAALGSRSPIVLIDAGVSAVPHATRVVDDWVAKGMSIARQVNVRSDTEPDYDYLDEVTNGLRDAGGDAVVAIGGGSAMDLAKGVGILLRNPGRGLDYRGMDRIKHPGLPVVLLPTTAGTGSEVTRTASFVDRNARTKLGINGRHVNCAAAYLDPRLTVSCPASVTSASGLDALVHAIEAVTCRHANVVSSLLGREAVRLLFRSLARAVAAPDDLGARADALLGSHYAGLAMWNAGGGPASGISYPLGAHYHVPHGFAGGVLLPHVVAFNVAHGYADGYARLYEVLDHRDAAPSTDPDKARAFSDAFFALFARLAAPPTLGRWGVTADTVAHLTTLTLEQRQANLDANPLTFGPAEVRALIEIVAG
jgi:alcohol dehydrogenase